MRETGARSLGRTRTTDNAEIGTGPVGGAPRAGFARPMGYDPGRGLCVALQLIRESPSLVPIMPGPCDPALSFFSETGRVLYSTCCFGSCR